MKQLTRELNIAAKLKHANIVNLLEVVFDDVRAMLVMEMASDGQLYDLVATGTPLSEDRARKFFQQMVSALPDCIALPRLPRVSQRCAPPVAGVCHGLLPRKANLPPRSEA